MSDDLRQSAIERQLFIIGEAVANRLTEEFIASYPDMPWSEIRGMRNVLAHGYDFINLDIVWQTITNDIPHILYTFESLDQGE